MADLERSYAWDDPRELAEAGMKVRARVPDGDDERELIRAGQRTALSEASLSDGDGRLLAHATATCMILG